MKFEIDLWVKNIMTQHAEAAYPSVAIGFFFGKDASILEVSDLLPVSNQHIWDLANGFWLMRAHEFARENELELLGIYFSSVSKKSASVDLGELLRLPEDPYYLTIPVVHGQYFDPFVRKYERFHKNYLKPVLLN